MTKPCRQQIVEAVFAALQSVAPQRIEGGATASVTVELNRRIALTDDDLPHAGLFEGDEVQQALFAGEDHYELPLMVQGTVKGVGEDGALRANALRADIIKVLFANRTFGLSVRSCEPESGGDWIGVDVESAESEGFILAFRVTYGTVEADPYTFA